jgi:hypothetical protein
MEADDALHLGAGAGELDHGRAAEAVAGRGELGGVGARVAGEDVETGVDARTEQGAVGLVSAGSPCRRPEAADAFAVDVGNEDVVT